MISPSTRNLLYKEIREASGRAAILTIIAVIVGTITVLKLREDPIGFSAIMVFLVTAAGALFLGMAAAAGEQGRGTYNWMIGLPIARRSLAMSKLLIGLASVCLLPCVMVAVIAFWIYLLGLNKEQPYTYRYNGSVATWFIGMLALNIAMGWSVFAWTVALGSRRRTEINAGLACAAAILGWTMLAALCMTALSVLSNTFTLMFHPSEASAILFGPPFYGVLFGMDPLERARAAPELIGVGANIVTTAVLLGWAACRYGRPLKQSASNAHRITPRQTAIKIRPALRSPVRALIWQTWRQCRLAVGVCLTILMGMVILEYQSLIYNISINNYPTWSELFREAAHTWNNGLSAFGLLFTVFIGIAIFSPDLRPGINTFWQSRPISNGRWFWVKFFTGATLLVVLFHLPPVIFKYLNYQLAHLVYFHPQGIGIAQSFKTVLYEFVFSINRWDRDAQLLMIHLHCYAITAMVICLVRQPIYSAILAITGAIALLVIPLSHDAIPNWNPFSQSLGVQTDLAAFLIAASIFIITSTWIARLAASRRP